MDRLSSKGAMVEDIRLGKVPTSGFDLSHHSFGTGKLGKIIPTMISEVYPGDRFKGNPVNVVNFEPLVAPVMGSMVTKQEGFFVPYYQIWSDAPKFFTEKKGYNQPVPSISPLGVWEAYAAFELLGLAQDSTRLTLIYNDINTNDYQDEYEYAIGVESTIFAEWSNYYDALVSFGEHYYVRDLLQPLINLLYKFKDEIRNWVESYKNSTDPVTDRIRYEIARKVDAFVASYLNYLFGASSLFDYLGFPFYADFAEFLRDFRHSMAYCMEIGVEYSSSFVGGFSEIALPWTPFRAYYLVWYWNYRDQLLELDAYDPEEQDFLQSSVSNLNCVLCSLLRVRCWFKDAYTTALTNTGTGNFQVPVAAFDNSGIDYEYYTDEGELLNTKDYLDAYNAGATVCKISFANTADVRVPMNYLSGAFQGSYDSTNSSYQNAVSLDLFDRIKRLRTFTQKHLINGYEMDDVIWASFEVKLSNIRMHIPEILMRGRDVVEMNTIVNNTTTAEQIAGDKTATAYCKSVGSEMNYFSEEWGLYIQNMTVMPVQCYPEGMKRLYLKRNRLDFAWPEFATMGFDAIYNCELATLGKISDADALAVFGYQGRYYDIKSFQDEAHGRMRTDMNYYIFGRKFDKDNLPKLNYAFVHCWPPLDMFVVDSEYDDVFRYDCYCALGAQRKYPVASEIIG